MSSHSLLAIIPGNAATAQRARLLEALRSGPLSTLEARRELDVLHPAARVQELRERGHPITTTWTFEATPCGERHRVARYVLLTSPRMEVTGPKTQKARFAPPRGTGLQTTLPTQGDFIPAEERGEARWIPRSPGTEPRIVNDWLAWVHEELIAECRNNRIKIEEGMRFSISNSRQDSFNVDLSFGLY